MTPEQHETEAERLLATSEAEPDKFEHEAMVARAQVHVLLALSKRAGKAMSTESRYPGGWPR